MNKPKGFTIAELVISIVVIGILAIIVTISMMSVRKGSRDTVRETNALTIAEELERYYEQHGEYPGCSALTASANDIRANTLKNIEIGALLTPNIDSSYSSLTIWIDV